MKMKILKFCDWNYKDITTNHTNVTKVEIIEQDQYYTSYYDVFNETLVIMKKTKKECLTTTVNVGIDNLSEKILILL